MKSEKTCKHELGVPWPQTERNLHSEIWLVPTTRELVAVKMAGYKGGSNTYSATLLDC
jgi:hypothetical protein